jgi:hypothetical protein
VSEVRVDKTENKTSKKNKGNEGPMVVDSVRGVKTTIIIMMLAQGMALDAA